MKVYLVPLLAVYELPKGIGVDGLPTALPFKAIEDAEAPVNEVPTTRLLVPTVGGSLTVIRLFVEVTVTAPEDLIWVLTSIRRTPFPARERGPTLFVPENMELVNDAVLVAVPPILKEPKPE